MGRVEMVSTRERKVKVLLSKLGLDVHNRGVITVAKELRDAGMEVIYLGNLLPEEIIEAATQENVDIVGVSSLGGAHLTLGGELIQLAKQRGLIKDGMKFVIGGVFPPIDAVQLQQIGFGKVFSSGATKDEIVASMHELVRA